MLKKVNYLVVVFGLMFALSVSILNAQTASSILPEITNFKLELPLDKEGKDYKKVKYKDRANPHIKSASVKDLDGYVPSEPFDKYFFVKNDEVVFRAHCAGALTSPNAYPRCELRQLVNGKNSFWDFQEEQELTATFRVTSLPDIKEEVCMLQIKGNTSLNTSGTSEVMRLEFRDESSELLHLIINEETKLENIMPYKPGQAIKARLYINKGEVHIELTNLKTKDTFSHQYKSAYPYGYFKAGCYTQSSIWKEKNRKGIELARAYGEVRFSELSLGGIVAAEAEVKEVATAEKKADKKPVELSKSDCPISVPDNRTVVEVTSNSVSLSWDFDPIVDHYNVQYKAINSSEWAKKAVRRKGSVTFKGLTEDTAYEWYIRAKCKNGEGTKYSDGKGPAFETQKK